MSSRIRIGGRSLATLPGLSIALMLCAVSAWAQVPINLGDVLSGDLQGTDPHSVCLGQLDRPADRYVFMLSAPTTITIDVHSSVFDTYLCLLDASGGGISSDDNSGPGTDARLTWNLLTGTYFIEVSTRSPQSQGGPYTISLQSGYPPAAPIALGQVLNETLSSTAANSVCLGQLSDPADRYQFTLSAPTTFTIDLSATAFDTYLCLLNSTNDGIWSDDNSGPGTNARIWRTALATGTYYIEVSTRSPGGTGGPYTLSLQPDYPAATPIASGQVVEEVLSDNAANSVCLGQLSDPADRYEFTLVAPATVTIDLSSTVFDTYLCLLDSKNVGFWSDDNSGGGTNSRIVHMLSTGRYFIEVSTRSVGGMGGPYTLSLTGPPSVPAAPTNLTAAASSASAINLTWSDNSGNETGFKVERKTGSNGTYAQVAAPPQNATSYGDSGLAASTQYCYRVRATNGSGDSAYSNEACATTASQSGTPGPFSLAGEAHCVHNPQAAAVMLSWTGSAGAASFMVYRNGSPYSGSLPATQLSYDSSTGVIAGQTYNYFVRAANLIGTTDSNTFSVSVPTNVCADCTLTCSAAVPPSASSLEPVLFSATATTGNCVRSPTYLWDFGDASPPSTHQHPSHTYSVPGTYEWTVNTTVDDNVTCRDTGVITVEQSFGTTVITHGYQPPDPFPGVPAWAKEMAKAVVARAGRGRVLLYDRPSGDFKPLDGAPQDGNGETVLLFDWAEESNENELNLDTNTQAGFSEAAGDALFAALMKGKYLSHLHFVGHSRGTVVNSEAAERLIALGFDVEQITMLDPVDHGYGFELDDFDVNLEHQAQYGCACGVVAWEGVQSATDFYRNNDSACPVLGVHLLDFRGQLVGDSVVVNLTDRNGGKIDHCDVHAWYYYTINTSATEDGGGLIFGIPFDPNWYGTAGPGCGSAPARTRQSDGFFFSRLGGGAVYTRLSGGPGFCNEPSKSTTVRFDFGSSREGIVNGDFARPGVPGDIPGWNYHGGGAEDTLYPLRQVAVEDRHLVLSEGQRLTHNRVWIPANALALTFRVHVDRANGFDALFVRFGTGQIELGHRALSNAGEYDELIDLTNHRGELSTFSLGVEPLQLPQLFPAKVWIEDIHFVFAPARGCSGHAAPAPNGCPVHGPTRENEPVRLPPRVN